MSRIRHLAHTFPLLALTLAGCAAERHAKQLIRTASDASVAAVRDPPKVDLALGNPDVAHIDAMYFGQSVFRRRHGDELPARYDAIVMHSNGEIDLRGFAALVSKATDIPIALGIKPAPQQLAQQLAPVPAAGALTAAAPVAPVYEQLRNPNNRPVGPTFQVIWQGPLAGLLDMACAKYGVAWEYRDGVIQISDEQTQTFIINKLPTTDNFNNELSTTSGGSGTSSAASTGSSATSQTIIPVSNQEAAQKATVDVWGDIKNSVAVIVGERGHFSVAPATGTITVTAAPAVLEQVAQFVRTENELMTRQVFVRIRVYSVELQEGDNFALNFNAKFQNAASGLGLQWQSPGTAPTTAVGSLTASVISATSKLSGSDVVAQALASFTNTALITDLNVTALNNQPVTKQDVVTASYLSSVATTVTQTTSTTALTPSTVSTGFSMTLLPRILTDNRILIGYSLSLSSLVALNSQTSGGNSIQLPTVAGSAGMQEAMLKSGQVLMLMGYVSETASDAKQGTGIPTNLLLGGTANASTDKKRIIITMEPVIVSGPTA